MFVAICPKCKKKVAVPRPGSIPDMRRIVSDCPFCQAQVCSDDGFEVFEPRCEPDKLNLLKVN